MVREVVTSPSRVVCVVGLAGAGKTTATHAVAQVFAQAGIPVLGAAPSGVAAEKLQDETGHSRRRRSIACSTRRAVMAACLPAACSSSTRPAWPRRASSRPSSTSSSRRTARRS